MSRKSGDCHQYIDRAEADPKRARVRSGAALALVALAYLLLAACGTNTSADGGANDNGARGHIKLGIPF